MKQKNKKETGNLDRIRKSINAEYEKLGMKPPINEPEPIAFIDTGFETLNEILGGGWPKGKIVELWGGADTGKTTLAEHAIVEAQRQGIACVFIDIERTFNPVYAASLGVDIKKLIYAKVDYAEQALDIAYQFAETGEVGLIVLDSVASLCAKSTTERDMDQEEQARLARILSSKIPKFIPILDNNGCTFIFINQIREKVGMMWGNPRVTPGGHTLKFNAFMRVELNHKEYVKEGDAKVADIIRCVVKKTKATEPLKETELRLNFGKGFDRYSDLLDKNINEGKIIKSGAFYIIGETKIHGEEAILKWLEEHKDEI